MANSTVNRLLDRHRDLSEAVETKDGDHGRQHRVPTNQQQPWQGWAV